MNDFTLYYDEPRFFENHANAIAWLKNQFPNDKIVCSNYLNGTCTVWRNQRPIAQIDDNAEVERLLIEGFSG